MGKNQRKKSKGSSKNFFNILMERDSQLDENELDESFDQTPQSEVEEKKSYSQLVNENQQLKEEVWQLQEELEKYKSDLAERNNLEEIYSNLKLSYEKRTKDYETLINNHKSLKEKLESSLLGISLNSDPAPQNNEQQSEYDVILQMKSIRELYCDPHKYLQAKDQISDGIKIQKLNEGLNTDFQNVTLVSFEGFKNSGKTFILNDLTGKKYPSDYHLSTPGISLAFESENMNNKLFIDTKAIECSTKVDYSQNTNYQKLMQCKAEEYKIDEQCEQELTEDIQRMTDDLMITSQIEQDFVIESSDILILVVSQLTSHEQNLIERVSSKFFSGNNSRFSKRLIIVHNLKDYKQPKQVEDYIENELKNIYPLSEQVFSYQMKHKDEKNVIYTDDRNPKLNHVVIGCKNSPAGRVYNNFTIYALKHLIEMYSEPIHFNVSQKFRGFLNRHLLDYVNLKTVSDEKTKLPSEGDLIILNKEENLIYLQPGFTIDTIKEQKSHLSKKKEEQYSIMKNKDNTEKTLIIELPGINKCEKKFDMFTGVFEIRFTLNEDIESQYGNLEETTRNFGQKRYLIPISKKDEIWTMVKDQESNNNLQNGIYKFVFKKLIQEDFT